MKSFVFKVTLIKLFIFIKAHANRAHYNACTRGIIRKATWTNHVIVVLSDECVPSRVVAQLNQSTTNPNFRPFAAIVKQPSLHNAIRKKTHEHHQQRMQFLSNLTASAEVRLCHVQSNL